MTAHRQVHIRFYAGRGHALRPFFRFPQKNSSRVNNPAGRAVCIVRARKKERGRLNAWKGNRLPPRWNAATVYRVALSCVKNRESAEDIMQDVFLKLLRRKDAFESAEHMKRWLIRCTVNAGRDLLASAWRRKATPLDALYDVGEEPDWEERALFDMVMRLPKQCRVICYMHYYEGYSTEEIASILGIRGATVRVQLMKARKKLKADWLESEATDGKENEK